MNTNILDKGAYFWHGTEEEFREYLALQYVLDQGYTINVKSDDGRYFELQNLQQWKDKSDYENAVYRSQFIPKISLGQEVDTPDGRGIVVSLDMPFNGLYVSPEKSKVTVWFSTERQVSIASAGGRNYISWTYNLTDITPI